MGVAHSGSQGPAGISGGQLHVGRVEAQCDLGYVNRPITYQTLPKVSNGGADVVLMNSGQYAAADIERGVMNTHIRFFSEEFKLSDYSDSIEAYVGDEQRLMMLRQRNRKKKNSSAL